MIHARSQGTLPIVGVVAEIMVVKVNLNLETTAMARAVRRVENNL